MIKSTIVITSFILLLSACNPTIKQRIKSYEKEKHACIIEGEINLMYAPFLAKDSITILRTQYIQEKESRIKQLESAKQELQDEITRKEKEEHTIISETLKKHFRYRVDKMIVRAQQLEENIVTYQEHPEKTQLNVYLIRIKEYQKDSNQLIAYKVKVNFHGKQGMLASQLFHKDYLLTLDKKQILAEFSNQNNSTNYIK